MSVIVLNMSVFEPRYKSGLIFSMIEGLKKGNQLRLICDEDPKDLKEALDKSQIQNINYHVELSAVHDWVLTVDKKDRL